LNNHSENRFASAATWLVEGGGERNQSAMIPVMQIHFDEEEGHLRLECGEQEFTHLRDLVICDASAGDRIGPYIDGIRSIAVCRLDVIHQTTPRHFGRKVQTVLIASLLSVSLVIQIIGIIAIARWLLGHGP
jgi:hypothetical protein